MNVITIIILAFSLLGLIDRIIGNKLGLGAEFERGFELFSAMALSMIGMIIIAPAIGVWLEPVFDGFYKIFRIDPSVVPSLLFANDMGGASLSAEIARNESIGLYNAYVVSSMMGCVISFTIPFASGIVDKSQHKELFFGLLCGIVTIPVGCIVAGLILGIFILDVLINLLPMIIISAILAVGITLVPDVSVKIFKGFGFFMKALICVGLGFGIFTLLTGKTVFSDFDTLENGALICVRACVTLSGAFPFMYVIRKLLEKPTKALSKRIGINTVSALGFLPTLITNATTYGMMRDMDKKGVVLNSAFAVSASFVFGSHLGFTMGLNEKYVLPMIVAKLLSGVCAVALAALLYGKLSSGKKNPRRKRQNREEIC